MLPTTPAEIDVLAHQSHPQSHSGPDGLQGGQEAYVACQETNQTKRADNEEQQEEQPVLWLLAESDGSPFTLEALLEPTLKDVLQTQQLDWDLLEATLLPLLEQLPNAFLHVYGWETVLQHLQPHVSLDALQHLTADVTFCGNATIQTLNQETREKASPTDVLSFPTWEGCSVHSATEQARSLEVFPVLAVPEVTLGGLVVSVEWAWQQCQQHAKAHQQHAKTKKPHSAAPLVQDLAQEMLCVFLIERVSHGLLHLCGQHHATQETYQAVLMVQATILKALNLPVTLSTLQHPTLKHQEPTL